jgi:glycyl-tRNA synthetase alpha subunit
MTEAQKKYVITEEQLSKLFWEDTDTTILNIIRSRPVNTSERAFDNERFENAITKILMKRFYGVGEEISDAVEQELRQQERERP